MTALTRRKFTTLIAVLLTAPILSGGAVAFDLTRVTVDNHEEGARLASLVDHAVARRGNDFIIVADGAVQAEFRSAQLGFQILMRDIELSDLYLVASQDRTLLQQSLDWETVGESVSIDGSRRIVRMSRAMAASLSAGYRVSAVPLSERRVPIGFAAPSIPGTAPEDVIYDTLAPLVSQDSIYSYNKRLEDFYTRYVFTDSVDAARDWLEAKFISFGYVDVNIQPFWHTSWAGTGYGYNVFAVKEGTIEPDKVVMIGAHYDSYCGNCIDGRAPGADDNASGVALVLELARILADQPLRKTVMFVAFAAEEQWMFGSGYLADSMYAAGTKLEAMFNYDMVAYTADSYWDIEVHSEYQDAYRAVTSGAAGRVTLLHPTDPGLSRPSDNYPFEDYGYTTVRVEEADFNTPNYHKVTDLCSELNFPYLAEVTKMALVALAAVSDAPYPSQVADVLDVGDGSSLQVTWTDCSPDCAYRVCWGSSSGQYDDSVLVLPGECQYTITGIDPDQECFITAYGISPQSQRAFYGIEGSGTPMLYPRAPSALNGTPASSELRLDLDWQANRELDLSHYRLYRRYGTVGEWQVLADGLTGTTYADLEVLPHVGYEYAVTAVDETGYESMLSSSVLLYPATYDGGPVVADGFVMDHEYDPTQPEQEAWLDTILGPIGFGVAPSDEHGGPVTLGSIGQYGTLLWIDDDVITKNIAASNATLDEYSKHGTNMLISGWRTWVDWSAKTVPTSHLLYREFGLASYEYTSYFDFVGAVGVNGWPSVQIDPSRGMREWRDISKLVGRSGAQVILTFDSELDLPDWEGKPVGIVYSTANGKRVLLSFPIYYLTPSSATALMAKVFEYFAVVDEYEQGDLDHSGTIDIGDIAILIDHLFINMEPLLYPEEADMDGRAGVSIGDVFYLIDYLFMGGPSPVPEM